MTATLAARRHAAATDLDSLERDCIDLYGLTDGLIDPLEVLAVITEARCYRFLRDHPDAMWRPFGIRSDATVEEADAAVLAAMEKAK